MSWGCGQHGEHQVVDHVVTATDLCTFISFLEHHLNVPSWAQEDP
jgi:hypothetical protein